MGKSAKISSNRYGKPSAPILEHKAVFFEDNDSLKRTALDQAKLYTSQPLRKSCKICDTDLAGAKFAKQGVPYIICDFCGHLNGGHDDTAEFCQAIYTDDGGASYGKNYAASDKEDYFQRRDDIYGPKADFLIESLGNLGEDPLGLRFVDFGAGAGYFVSALLEKNITSVCGYEVSENQIAMGNHVIGTGFLRNHELADVMDIVATDEADVVSMIGVLEHIQHPRRFIEALRKNEKIRYFFLSVPLFSPTVYFEMVFPEIMHRQLTGGHTHLFTESSIAYMAKEFDLEEKAAWWFGSDLVDLYRSVLIKLQKQPDTTEMTVKWKSLMGTAIDDLQLTMDKLHMSSEVHLLFEVKR